MHHEHEPPCKCHPLKDHDNSTANPCSFICFKYMEVLNMCLYCEYLISPIDPFLWTVIALFVFVYLYICVLVYLASALPCAVTLPFFSSFGHNTAPCVFAYLYICIFVYLCICTSDTHELFFEVLVP